MYEKTEKTGFKAFIGVTFLIGFGFFTMGLMDPLYDTYVPLFLRRYIRSNALVGAIMTFDNILQLMLIPIVSLWSDRTSTRIGRRMPFIIVMLPLSALLFTLFPSAAGHSLTALVILIFCFNIFKTSVRGPVVSLMPDTIPGEFRSEANGVINMMGGIGLIVGTLVLAQLMNISESLPFIIAGICIGIAVIVLYTGVHEKPLSGRTEEQPPMLKSLRLAFSAGDSSVPRILGALFFWFMAYEGAKPFLGLYLVEVMHTAESNAALAQGVAGISSVIMAVPVGYLAHRIGRRNFIRLSLVGAALVLFLIPLSGFVTSSLLLNVSAGGSLVIFLILMFLYGAVWMGIVVNSFPMLWQMASFGTVGVYTGLYYMFSQGAAIFAPPITGFIIDAAGYEGIFIFGGICMSIAWVIMGGVKKGEASSDRLPA
ncbi:MAG: MFS transporter [Treponema sp.]|jgi:MFS family permease|nr:MFS transporter [Treponema sp.]